MHTTAPFPLPGSEALLDGTPVRIHQQIDRCTVLVFGEKLTRRADLSELAPPPEPTLFARWLGERVVTAPTDPEARVPAIDLADDYRAWLSAQGAHGALPVSDYVFLRMMREAGHPATTGYWRAPGDSHARTRVLFRVVLRSTGA